MTTEEEFKEHLRAKRHASMEDDIDALKDQVYELEDLLHNHLSFPLAYDWEGDVRAATPYPADPGAKVHKDIGIGRAANSKSKKPSAVKTEPFVTFTSNGPVYGKIALITGCLVHHDAKLGGYVVEGGLPSWNDCPAEAWTPESMVDDYAEDLVSRSLEEYVGWHRGQFEAEIARLRE